uniref:Uncharacterized protein n=1 Tax=Tanacetum cinerariifolium TaxID=118510 RepID=A0A699HIT8_TANCI|nr:hypothetical protein [Tanacetum cinerariifolium]
MIADIDSNEDIYLVNVHKDKDIFGVNDSDGNEVIVEDIEMFVDVTDDLRSKEVFVAQQDDNVVEKEEQRLTAEKAQQELEANIALIESWDDVQAKIDVDYELAQRLQAEEQKELTDAEKAKLFMEFLKKKFFAAKRVEEKRNIPPTRAQQRTIITELLEESSKKAVAEITQEGSSKRAGDELEQERSKKQKVEDDKDSEELKKCLEIIPDDGDDVTIDATPLSSKCPTIIDYKIYKEGKKIYFQIFRADDNSQMYLTFSKMLKIFDIEDMEVLWRLVTYRFEKVKPMDNMDSFLLHNLKAIFKHHVEDNVWKNQQGLVKVKS